MQGFVDDNRYTDRKNIIYFILNIAKYKKYDNELPGAIRAQLYIGRTNR